MPFPANACVDSSHFTDSRVTAHKRREYAVSSINIGLYDLCRPSLLYFIDSLLIRRTRERVEVSATAAGIHGQKHCIQLLSFGEKLNNGELRLMEVNKDVMEDLQDGRRLEGLTEAPRQANDILSAAWVTLQLPSTMPTSF